ncbi:alpha/beta fold hydrolase [Ochrobactrum sp. MYb379]|uniref:alpha/beta fold hydrolase n=1 Tax=Ochrobactrum sp. MYb379 TaxID=2745275 RepID=UPI00309E0FFE
MMTNLGNYQLSSILISPVNSTIEATIIFIHGASCSLLDPYFTFSDLCLQNMQMLFVDRPGHGQSEQGPAENIRPDAQADAIARLMQIRGIDNAIIVGHSYGGAVAAALAVRHPERVVGLILLSPAAYPWVGGISWYNNVAQLPVIGTLFSLVIAPTIGILSLKTAMKSVFTPNKYPTGYICRTKAWQALRPRSFRHNARELGALCEWAETAHEKYKQILAPTIIITGHTDNIVSPDVHARRLAKDITLSELYVIKGMGHKSDYVARNLVTSAIEKVAGRDIDLSVVAKQVERQIVDEAKEEKGPV